MLCKKYRQNSKLPVTFTTNNTQNTLMHITTKTPYNFQSRNVRLRVRLSVYPSFCPSVRLSVCSLLRYRLNVFLPPLPEVGCPIFVEIRNSWGKVMETSGLRLEHFCLEVVSNRQTKNIFFLADFALQSKVETTLPDGLETSGKRAYC